MKTGDFGFSIIITAPVLTLAEKAENRRRWRRKRALAGCCLGCYGDPPRPPPPPRRSPLTAEETVQVVIDGLYVRDCEAPKDNTTCRACGRSYYRDEIDAHIDGAS
jgi:hypothetical protein